MASNGPSTMTGRAPRRSPDGLPTARTASRPCVQAGARAVDVLGYAWPASSGARPMNAATCRRRQRTGSMARSRKMSMSLPRRDLRASPAASMSGSGKPSARRWRVSASHAAGAYPACHSLLDGRTEPASLQVMGNPAVGQPTVEEPQRDLVEPRHIVGQRPVEPEARRAGGLTAESGLSARARAGRPSLPRTPGPGDALGGGRCGCAWGDGVSSSADHRQDVADGHREVAFPRPSGVSCAGGPGRPRRWRWRWRPARQPGSRCARLFLAWRSGRWQRQGPLPAPARRWWHGPARL